MRRNFNHVVNDLEGRPHLRQLMKYDPKSGMPIMDDVSGRKVHAFDRFEPMTLRQYALDALAGRWPGEEQMSHEDLWKRMKIHDKIAFAMDGEAELVAEDLPIILNALTKSGQSAFVIGRMKDFLETDPPAPAAPAAAPGADTAAPAASSAP